MKKIATIEVYEDSVSGSSQSAETAPGVWTIFVNPTDLPIPSAGTKLQLETSLAHELGHVIAGITHDPTHNNHFDRMTALTGNAAYVLPAERKAWELARIMLPKMDEEYAEACISTYEKHSKPTGGRR